MVTSICFGNVRKFCDRTAKISICLKETLEYENFSNIRQVPHSYDSYFLYGIGVIDSEFEDDGRELDLFRCLEIVLSKEPRQDFDG